VARGCGLHASYISLLLRGKRNPRLTTARKVADAMGVSLDELFLYLQSRGLSFDTPARP
jgi:transcriptional regulator with XRE-family HTH domain